MISQSKIVPHWCCSWKKIQSFFVLSVFLAYIVRGQQYHQTFCNHKKYVTVFDAVILERDLLQPASCKVSPTVIRPKTPVFTLEAIDDMPRHTYWWKPRQCYGDDTLPSMAEKCLVILNPGHYLEKIFTKKTWLHLLFFFVHLFLFTYAHIVLLTYNLT